MYYISPRQPGEPIAYGAPPPGTYLTSLDGKIIALSRINKVEGTSPQRYKAYTSCIYFNGASVIAFLKYRLSLQIQIDTSNFTTIEHEGDMVKVLSCGQHSEDNKDEEIYIELESYEPNDRLTDEEVEWIRSLD